MGYVLCYISCMQMISMFLVDLGRTAKQLLFGNKVYYIITYLTSLFLYQHSCGSLPSVKFDQTKLVIKYSFITLYNDIFSVTVTSTNNWLAVIINLFGVYPSSCVEF